SESEGSAGGHWKSKPMKQNSSMEDDLSQPWVCEETDPFTPRIRYFDFPKTRMPSHIKTYDGSEDPKDHLKIFQAAGKTKRWAMPTWCHMFNSTLTENARVWFDDLPKESIDSYDDLRKAFLENYLQQKKCIKDLVEIHNIKQRNGESTKEFVRRYKLKCRDVKGAPECMKISGFMHGITNPELIKRLHDKIPKSMDEMMSVTTAFLNGEISASNQERKRFTLLTKTPGEILAIDKGKFKPPPPMTTPVEKRNASKFCEFHREVGHTTDECMHLKRKIEERLKAGKLSHLIKELKQNHRKDQAKITKKGEISSSRGRRWDGRSHNIEAEMGGHCVHRIYVDGGSSLEIFGEIIWPIGQISLLVRIGDEEHSTSAWMNFMAVRSPSPYNEIIGRPWLRKIRAIPSTAHEMIKFPVADGIVTFQSSRIISLECSMVSEPGVPRSAINQVREEKIQVAIHPEYPKQTVAIGSTLTDEGRKELCGLLRRHLDVFAWKLADMTGVPRHIAEHRLNVREGCLAISWLSNPVMVKKHDDSWRMYVDFKDLNKAFPNDGYPLPKIDCKIKMAEEDEEKTAFITSQGIFCYSKMSFGLKNAGVTHQRLVDKAFQKQIGRNLEVYVDDLVIKSRTKKEVIKDREETFKTLRKINMKLNPKKCAFGMKEGTFLGYKVDADGLRVSSDKVKAVLDLLSPKCLKDVQKLDGKLASLNRFLSKSAKKSLPLFKTLKKCAKTIDFQWTPEAEGAFKEIKQSIAELPMLTAPKEKEELIMYLAAAKGAISAVLMTKRDGKQVPVYFVSLKGQILADFIVERPPIEDREELPDPWILFTDGSSCIDGSGACLIITHPERMEFTYALRFRFNATNNEAEYEALIAGIWIARQIGVQNLQANVDSKQVANQVNGIYIANESSMIRTKGKAIEEKEILAVVEEEGHTWMTPVYEYLTEGILPEEKRKQGLCVARQKDMT
nr:reverse transcriptase domain-containing protein [Tanacetum cinerariifolium]